MKANKNNKRKIGVVLKTTIIVFVSMSLFLLTSCKKGNVLTVVGSGGYRPFNYIDNNGDVIGFDVDTAKEIASRMDMELDYQTGEWSGLVEGLRNKRYDAIIGSMAITEERKKEVNFTSPYYFSGAQLIVKINSGFSAPDDLKGLDIGVTTGSNFVEDVRDLGANPRLYDDDNSTIMDLLAGRVDGVITDKIVALEAMSKIKDGNQLTLCGSLLRKEEMGIAIHPNDDKLLEEIDKIIQEMHEDGTLSQISQKWLNGEDLTKG